MSFLTLLDHQVVIHRATTTPDRFGGTVETWTPLLNAPGNNARPNQAWSGDLQNPGPGEVQVAHRQWFLRSDVGARERDLFQVVAGAEAPGLFRIVSVTRPTNAQLVHHLEVNVEPTTETLP